MRRHTCVRQVFLTQYAKKFAGKTCAYDCEDRFLIIAHNIYLIITNQISFVNDDNGFLNALRK